MNSIHRHCLGLGLLLTSALGAQTIVDTFPGTTLNTSNWTASAFVGQSTTGSVTVNDGLTLTARGRITSAFGFTGPLTITGTVSFPDTQEYLSIIFRSSGAYDDPTYGSASDGVGVLIGPVLGAVRFHLGDSTGGNDILAQSFSYSTNTPYNFKITDDGFNIAMYLEDLGTPLFTTTSSASSGDLVAFYSRENIGTSVLSAISISGSGSAVPEPSTYAALAGLAALGLAWTKRRRRVVAVASHGFAGSPAAKGRVVQHRLLFPLRVAAGLMLAVLPASAQQILLSASSLIGGGPSYDGGTYNSGFAPATRAVDEQTGAIGIETDQRDNYWLGPDGLTSSYFVLDLGAAYTLGQIELFNTHNWESIDRSTLAFHVNASNSIAAAGGSLGMNLVSPTTILSGTLPFSADNPPADNIYLASNGLNVDGPYRYLSFTFDSYSDFSGVPGAGNGGGLHEIIVTAVPEPATTVLLAGAAVFALAAIRRRRRTA